MKFDPALIISTLYLVILLFTMSRILLDTHSTSKTLAYLMLVIVLPGIGMILYYSLGINYRHHRENHKAVAIQRKFDEGYKREVEDHTSALLEEYKEEFGFYSSLVDFQHKIMSEYMSENSFELLVYNFSAVGNCGRPSPDYR